MGKNKKNKCYLRRQEKFIENMRINGSKSNQELKNFIERQNFREKKSKSSQQAFYKRKYILDTSNG
jgi:tRNA splicing ligase